jgi:hypothetical protein
MGRRREFSYGNHRNTHPEYGHRESAAGYQQQANMLSRQATNENIANRQSMQKGIGTPGLSNLIADQDAMYTPTEHAMNEAQQMANKHYDYAAAQEQANAHDRNMDLAENQLMANVFSGQYAADAGVEASNYQADRQVDGLKAINDGFKGVLGNLNNPGTQENAPDVYYTDEYGNPIGQTTWNQRNR